MLGKVLAHPLTMVAAIVLGILFGMYVPGYHEPLQFISKVYIDLLKMLVLPFLVSAIIVSVHRLVSNPAASRHMSKIVIYVLLGQLAVGSAGVAYMVAAQPGSNMATATMQAFGRLVESDASAETRISLLTPYAGSHENVAISLIMRMVPDNIFSSLSAGDTLKTLIFVLFFGISLASVRKGSNSLVDACEVTSLACQKMMFWVLYALPFASFALAADQVASNGVEPFKVMGRFIVALSVVAVVLMFLCITVIWFKAKTSLADVLRSQQRPFFVAAATRSTVACMPSMTFAMSELGFSKAMSELLVPLGTALFRVGPVVYYCMATIFIAQLYGRNMSIPDYGLVLVASLIVGFSSSGMSGIATISQTTIVCSLMGLPFEAALVLFIAVEPVCDTLRTILAVLSIDSLVALIAPLEREACEPALARITAASLA